MIDNQAEVERFKVEDRNIVIDDFPCYVLVGVRRAGKSYMLYHRMQQLLKQGYKWSQMLYVNFEDERLADFTSEDFNLLLECHAELATRIRYQIYYMNTAIDTHLSRIHFQQIACKELHIKAVFEEALLCGHSQIEYFMSNLCVF